MRRIFLMLPLICIMFTCNDREDYFANANQKVTVSVESPLTACTAHYPGFIDLDYDFKIALAPEYVKADPLPLVAQFKCENFSDFQLFFGNKKYTPEDTILFKGLNKRMKLNIIKPGTYRFLITFYKENKKETTLGQYEFTFVIGAPDLNIYIVRDGKKITKLDDSENFLGFEGSFIVRVNSEKEDLNKGRLTLTTNITGSSVQVKNWRDKESKISQSDDLPKTIDFVVDYKNIQVGKTKFVFSAQSPNSTTVLRDSMNIQESRPGSLALNTTFDTQKHVYSRPILWVGQADSVEYLITPDPKAVSSVYKIKFEMADPTKLWIFNTGKKGKQDATTMYNPNTWYDFSGKLTGKLFYNFPSPQTYKDTIFISMQNGDYGAIQKYKLFVQCKQSDDFVFKATFKPTLNEGFDEIKFSELVNGVTFPVILSVQDENPYAQFDYIFSKNNTNSLQDNIRQRFYTDPLYTAVDYQQYLGSRFGYLMNTKSFNVACVNTPAQNEAPGYSVNTFEWVYKVKRMSDSKEKTVTRKIRIINDLLKFQINLSANNREYIYQNEPLNTYQLIYDLPSKIADEYTIQVTSTDANIADVYLLQKDMSYKRVDFGVVTAAPATHNTSGSIIGDATTGMIQVKGKSPGTAKISFLLRHVNTGTSQTVTKTVETRADPVQYTIQEIDDSDVLGNVVSKAVFGSTIHSYRIPQYKIRFAKGSLYAGNTASNVKVRFANVGSSVIMVNGGGYSNTDLAYGTEYEFEYDKDYVVWMMQGQGFVRPFVSVNSTIGHDIVMRKGMNQEVQIETKCSNVRYNIRDYVPADLDIKWKSVLSGYEFYNIRNLSSTTITIPNSNPVTLTQCAKTLTITSGVWVESIQSGEYYSIMTPITLNDAATFTTVQDQGYYYSRDLKRGTYISNGDMRGSYTLYEATAFRYKDNWGYDYRKDIEKIEICSVLVFKSGGWVNP